MKFKNHLVLFLFFVLKTISVNCQDSSIANPNPIPIQDTPKTIRIKKDTIIKIAAIDSTKILLQSKKAANQLVFTSKYPTLNPINVFPYPTTYGKFTGAFLYADPFFNSTKVSIDLIQNVRQFKNKDWIFYLLSSLLFFLALMNVIFRKYFNDLFLVFFKTSMRQNQLTEQIVQAELPSLLLNVFFMVSSGLLLYFIFLYPKSRYAGIEWIEILYCIAIPTSIYFLKFIFIRIVSWLFSWSELGKIYIFNVFLVNKVVGLFFAALTIALAYAEPAAKNIFVTLTIIGLVFFIVMRLNKCFFATNQVVRITFTHFILFVVSFEVIPVLMMCKVLLRVIH
jgi:hypothetical protein